jgi:hypothetical protein
MANPSDRQPGICVVCKAQFERGWELHNHQQEGNCNENASADETVGVDDDEFVATDYEGSANGDDNNLDIDDDMLEVFHGEDQTVFADIAELENPPDHVCDDDCDCGVTDEVAFGRDDLLQYMSWGDCDVSPSGIETLRFLSAVLKGKSMSANKAEDLLRYVRVSLCFLFLFVSFCHAVFTFVIVTITSLLPLTRTGHL